MGTVSVANQAAVFLLAVCFGAGDCLLYDLAHSLWHFLPFTAFRQFCRDLTYWLLVTLGGAAFLILYCRGRVRLFVLGGFLIGFVLFRLLLSPFVRHLSEGIFRRIFRLTGAARRGLTAKIEKISMKLQKMGKKYKKSLERKPKGSV